MAIPEALITTGQPDQQETGLVTPTKAKMPPGSPNRDHQDTIEMLESLMRLHERRVLMTSWRILGSIEDAEDVTQEVFLRLWGNLDRLDLELPLEPWIYRVTVNTCLKLRRKRGLRKSLALNDLDPEQGIPATDPSSDPSARVSLGQETRIAEQALAALPEKQRVALVLRDIQGLSTREVADVLGSSETTVRSQISRARLAARQHRKRLLKGQGP